MDPESSPRQLGSTLHARLIAGDPTASAEIAEIALAMLREKFRFYMDHDADPQLAEQALVDAIMSYLERPSQYDPTRLDLFAYLQMSAKGDRRNAHSAAERRRGHVTEWPHPVANHNGSGEEEIELADGVDVEAEVLQNTSRIYTQVRAMFDSEIDLYMVDLLLEGVHQTRPYAIVLGITNVPYTEQVRIVKQHKDRIKARLRRGLDPEAIRAEARGND